jgi:hypothetical protein
MLDQDMREYLDLKISVIKRAAANTGEIDMDTLYWHISPAIPGTKSDELMLMCRDKNYSEPFCIVAIETDSIENTAQTLSQACLKNPQTLAADYWRARCLFAEKHLKRYTRLS